MSITPSKALYGGVERPDHAGDIAQGRLLDAPFLDGAAGFPLEVDDREVLAGEEKLTEVVVSVAADPLTAQSRVKDLLEPRENRIVPVDDPVSERPR